MAPLLLLRSPASTMLAARWFQSAVDRFEVKANDPEQELHTTAFKYAALLLCSVIVRVVATLRHPIKGVKEVPANWRRVVLCTDMKTPVELVPETGSVREILQRVVSDKGEAQQSTILIMVVTAFACGAGAHFARSIWSAWIWLGITWFFELCWLILGALLVAGMFCHLIGWMYRFSLKSTALLWAPLLHVVKSTFDESLPLDMKLQELCVSSVWRLIRIFSWVTLFLLSLKVVILPQVIGWWNAQPWSSVLNVYVMPNEIHTWHIVAAANSVFALVGYYLFIERASRHLSAGAWSSAFVANVLQGFTFVRGFLSIYTITVGVYLTVIAAFAMDWPRWTGRIFPW